MKMSETYYYNGSCTNMVMRQNGKPCDVSSIDAASECNRLLTLNEELEAKLEKFRSKEYERCYTFDNVNILQAQVVRVEKLIDTLNSVERTKIFDGVDCAMRIQEALTGKCRKCGGHGFKIAHVPHPSGRVMIRTMEICDRCQENENRGEEI